MSAVDLADLAADARPFRLPDGAPVRVRPIRPQDGDMLQAYLRRLSPASRRNRFLGALNELSPRELERLVRMDCGGACALLAFAGAGQATAMIGEAMAVAAPGNSRCEIAISVLDGWQGRGVGALLLEAIECRARRLGARYLFGDVLRTNTAMKRLARKHGFSVRSPFTDARLIEIVKDLSLAPRNAPCSGRYASAPPVAA